MITMSDRKTPNHANEGVCVFLGDSRSTQITVVGGKGASLGKLVNAGFPVPSGFVVTTDGYDSFIREHDLEKKIQKILAGLDYGNLDELETKTERIREIVANSQIPGILAREITKAYKALGDVPYVAVRSSGTAEDLEDASFAGQYDTYLDIKGGEELLDAVRQCWASMWTSRVTAYRQSKGFGHRDIGIAVVVQTMVKADAAGVMFTGNPMNARADEIAINASWGLGETVVSGAVTPDEYIVDRDTLKVKRRSKGTKAVRIVRNKKAGKGTIRQPVPPSLQTKYTLTNKKASELAQMGRRVMTYYEGLPQDIEWALAGGSFYLLQSRPVTGVHFTWEEDLDMWPEIPEDDDVIWTRSWADEFWHGAVTPLFWTVRGTWLKLIGAGLGNPHLTGDRGQIRWLKYHRGTVYFDTQADELIAEFTLPSSLRESQLSRVHPSRKEKVISAPFDLERIVKMFIKAEEQPGGGIRNINAAYETFRKYRKGGEKYEARLNGKDMPYPADPDFFQARPDRKALAALSDDELFDRVNDIGHRMGRFGAALTEEAQEMMPPPYRIYVGVFLQYILENWYDGNNPNAYTDVISGLPERTQQFHDDYDFWQLADTIRKSQKLLSLLMEFEGASFFEELKNHEEGREFLTQYEAFLETNGARGHADRDIYYPRRIEDPMIDYQALRLLATADSMESPEEREERLKQRREASTADVIANLEKQPLGALKAAAFRALQDVTLKQWIWRDDERSMGDTGLTWSKKILLCEIGRRSVSKGLLEGDRDFYFLGINELQGLFNGTISKALAKAKVAARAKDFDLFLAREADTPLFMKGNTPMDDGIAADKLADGNVLKGSGTSPGAVTARARVVKSLEAIGRLEKGDILICNSTDPGWTSAFSIVSGVVAETGGMAAHFSCLSREYGLPAVSLPKAMKLIEDGAMITVNGSTGEVRLA